MKDFYVKVYRYSEGSDGSSFYDGWFFSEVYCVRGNEFLVYDDGANSSCTEMSGEDGFVWVDFTSKMDSLHRYFEGEALRVPVVELHVPGME